MNKNIALAACLAAVSCTSFAQTTVQTERHVTSVQTASGNVKTVQTSTVVRHYVSYLYTVYTAVNIPQPQIIQLIELDLQILEARIRGDWPQVRVYIQRQVDIVGIPVVEHIHTYVHAHPVPAAIPVYAQPVWVNNVAVQNNNVNINVDVNKTEIQQAVKQNNISVEQLNVDQAVQSVKSGDINKIKAGATSNENDAANPQATKPGETPKPGATPAAGQTPKAGQTPNASSMPSDSSMPGRDDNAVPTPRTGPSTSGSPANPTPTMSPSNNSPSSNATEPGSSSAPQNRAPGQNTTPDSNANSSINSPDDASSSNQQSPRSTPAPDNSTMNQ